MMNDDRNNTKYICGTILNTLSNPIFADIINETDPAILYVAGEYQYTLQYHMLLNMLVKRFNHYLHAKITF